MKRCSYSAILFFFLFHPLWASTIEYTYVFDQFKFDKARNGDDLVYLNNCILSGNIGEPTIPFVAIKQLLPPNEVAVSLDIERQERLELPGSYNLSPRQPAIPLSVKNIPSFQKNETIYRSDAMYPQTVHSPITTQYMNGYPIGCASFTPVAYIPSENKIFLYQKVTIRITTALKINNTFNNITQISSDPEIRERIASFVQNPENLTLYPTQPRSSEEYDMVIITPKVLESSFKKLVDFYAQKKLLCKLAFTEDIISTGSGKDPQEKIRNHIIKEVNDSKIKYALLGGDNQQIPCRGFYCLAKSTTDYVDKAIPADIYYSALDGSWNENGNTLYGEKDDKCDMAPDISVGRLPCSSPSELDVVLDKIISYQSNPVLGELNKPLLAGEELDPGTLGSDGLNLLIGNTSENGFTTNGINKTDNIQKLYDTHSSKWNKSALIKKINEGAATIYHAGHANWNTVMRLNNADITASKFSKLDGKTHNYPVVNTIGCICGNFEKNDCIGELMVLNTNFAVAFIGNSRYGWYDNDTDDGPSARIQRFYTHALYNDKKTRIGTAHMLSKASFASHVDAQGEFEPGARRWCFYGCNLLGDPAMNVWVSNDPTKIIPEINQAAKTGMVLSCNTKLNTTTLNFYLAQTMKVSIDVYNANGRLMTSLLNQTQSAGMHNVQWNTKNITKGLYFVTLRTPLFDETKVVGIAR